MHDGCEYYRNVFVNINTNKLTHVCGSCGSDSIIFALFIILEDNANLPVDFHATEAIVVEGVIHMMGFGMRYFLGGRHLFRLDGIGLDEPSFLSLEALATIAEEAAKVIIQCRVQRSHQCISKEISKTPVV